MRYSKGSYNTKSWATADLPFDITGTHTVLLYLDLVEPNSVGDVKCPLLSSIPFKHREFYNDKNFRRSQVLSYRSFEHLRFHKAIKSNFHSIHVELRNTAGHLVPFFPKCQVQLTVLFQKRSWSSPRLSLWKQSAKMQMISLSHFMLDFSGKFPILEPILWSNEQQIFPTNSLNESTIEIQLETDCNIFTDLRSTQLFIRRTVIKGDQTRLDNAEETLLVNNALHSLFSNCEVYLNNEQVHSANSLYAHQVFVSAEFSGTKGTKESLSECQEYWYENESNDFTKRPFTNVVFQKDKDVLTFYGPSAIGPFACETLLLPNPECQPQTEIDPIISSLLSDWYWWAELWGLNFGSLPFYLTSSDLR